MRGSTVYGMGAVKGVTNAIIGGESAVNIHFFPYEFSFKIKSVLQEIRWVGRGYIYL